VVGRRSGKRRLCEERIIHFRAATPRGALAYARKHGCSAELDYKNDEGNPVYFEFIGVVDLLHLGAECEPDEVWYDIREMQTPMERKRKLIPSDSDLLASLSLV
jgi:hypothetical protein